MTGEVLVFVLSLLLTNGDAKPAQEMSLISETVKDVSAASAPANWNAECGGRTYVGSYTLMMDWADCKDYCEYFPHAEELGHTFDQTLRLHLMLGLNVKISLNKNSFSYIQLYPMTYIKFIL